MPSTKPEDLLGLPVNLAKLPRGCDTCRGTGYHGRTVLAEMLPDSDLLARAILAKSDVRQLERVAASAGMIGRWERGCAAVEAGLTSPAEIRRILGVATPSRRGEGEPADTASLTTSDKCGKSDVSHLS